MTTLKLYEATDALLTVREWIEEHAEEIAAGDGELPAELADLIDKSALDFAKKVEAVALFIRELEGTKAGSKAEADRLAARVKTLEHSVTGLKAYLEQQMGRADVPKLQGHLCSVSRQKNSTPSLRAVPDVALLPAEFVRTFEPVTPPPVADREKLVAAFKAGAPLPAGVEITVGYHIRIR